MELSNTRPRAAGSTRSLLQVFRWNRRVGCFCLPHDAHDPPTFAVVHQLKAVDAALEGLWVLGLVTRLIRPDPLTDVAVMIDFVGHAALEESFLFQEWR